MRRIPFPGGWYPDALPSGEYVVLYPEQHLDCHLGIIACPVGEPWGIGFPRITNINGFAFAGQAHSTTTPAAGAEVVAVRVFRDLSADHQVRAVAVDLDAIAEPLVAPLVRPF